MTFRKFIISNNIVWKVKEVKERKYQLAKKGTIERYLKGNNLENWLVDYLDYHVTVRGNKEKFDRVFVLTQQEAKEILFLK